MASETLKSPFQTYDTKWYLGSEAGFYISWGGRDLPDEQGN